MSDHFLRNAMEAHGDTVYRLALCRTQNAADAEDVYQDVFLSLLSQEDRDWDGEHLKAWLIRAASFTFDCTDEMGFPVQKRLVAELMGRTCNLYLLGPDGRILDCLRRIGLDETARRPALPDGESYRTNCERSRIESLSNRSCPK